MIPNLDDLSTTTNNGYTEKLSVVTHGNHLLSIHALQTCSLYFFVYFFIYKTENHHEWSESLAIKKEKKTQQKIWTLPELDKNTRSGQTTVNRIILKETYVSLTCR